MEPDSGEFGDELGDLLSFLRRQGGHGGGEVPIRPAPYLELEGRCRHWADQLVAGALVPGGGLAVRVARKGFDVARSRRKKGQQSR